MWKTFALILCFLCFVAAAVASAQPPLRIAYPSFPPFHSKTEDGRITGFFYDILTEALVNRMGVPVVWTAYPWPRCQENVKSGKADAILTVPTAERATYTVTHKVPFFLKELNVFTTVGHKKIEKIKAIRGIADIKKGGYSVITYSGNGWHQENIASLGIKTYETSVLKSVWKMLAANRGDIVLEWPLSAWPDIRQAGLSKKIVQTPVVISAMPFHMLIGKESSHTAVLSAFDDVIKEMQTDGTIDKIMAKYH